MISYYAQSVILLKCKSALIYTPLHANGLKQNFVMYTNLTVHVLGNMYFGITSKDM